MKAFNLNVKGRVGLSKKELEKQKLAEEKAAEAEALKQFVDTFERPSTGISFVKSGVINAGSAGTAYYFFHSPTFACGRSRYTRSFNRPRDLFSLPLEHDVF